MSKKITKIKAEESSNVYTGNVKLTFKHGDKAFKVIEKHNQGTVDFFEYILRAVTGQNVLGIMPSRIGLYSDKGCLKPILSGSGIQYESIGKITKTQFQAKVAYSFFVPDTLLQGKTIRSLSLNSADGLKQYAKITLDEDVVITSKTSLAIEWVITLANGD